MTINLAINLNMVNDGQHTKKFQHYEIYDFLEDRGFRQYILANTDESHRWLGIENELRAKRKHRAFQQAKVILLNLRGHFEHVGLEDQEIHRRIDLQIGQYRERVRNVRKKGWIREIGWQAAASILVIVGVVWLIQWVNRPVTTYVTGNGEQLVIELPDASVVHLNGNSKLTWDRHWEANKRRKIFLAGEGYFEVAKVNGVPMDVETNDVTIEVLGTVFNVNSRHRATNVFLEEGKVSMKIKRLPDSELVLKPGDIVKYDAANKKFEKTDTGSGERLIAWKDGLLIYEEEPLENVVRAVADFYGKTFVLEDTALSERRITTAIPLTDWKMSATAIKMAMRLEFEEIGDTIRIRQRE